MLPRSRRFEKIFRSNYERMYLYALYILGDREQARDAVSEVFAKAWETFSKIEPDTVETYLFMCVRNYCYDQLRRRNVRNSYAAAPEHEAELILDPDNWSEYDQRLEQIMQLIEQMPPQTRFIMEQCYLHEKTYKEMAAELGMSTSGVKQHIMKGLNAIRCVFNVDYKKNK